MAKEKAKRLAPLPETLRELFLKSGNCCAFPDCQRLMMNSDGVFIGQVCHIEGAEEGGERFNENQTNEERRHFSNLMLMCYDHHTITNDVTKYTAEVLRKMKADHEAKFTDVAKAIGESETPAVPVVALSLGMTQLWNGQFTRYLVIILMNKSSRPVFLGNFYLLLKDGRRLLFPRDTLTGEPQSKRRVEPGDRSDFHVEASDLKQFGKPPDEYVHAGVDDAVGGTYVSNTDYLQKCIADLLKD